MVHVFRCYLPASLEDEGLDLGGGLSSLGCTIDGGASECAEEMDDERTDGVLPSALANSSSMGAILPVKSKLAR